MRCCSSYRDRLVVILVKKQSSHLEVDVGLDVGLEHGQTDEGVLGGEGDRVVHRVAPLPELPADPDDRREALVRGRVRPCVPGYLQVGVAVEPQLLDRADEVRDLLTRVRVPADVQRPELQGVPLAESCLGCVRNGID